MQPKKQLKVQYIGIFEEIDSFYWPKMHPPHNSGNSRKKTFFFFIEVFPYDY